MAVWRADEAQIEGYSIGQGAKQFQGIGETDRQVEKGWRHHQPDAYGAHINASCLTASACPCSTPSFRFSAITYSYCPTPWTAGRECYAYSAQISWREHR